MRALREDYVGARHHVYNRGRRKEPMFDHIDACGLYRDLLSELPRRFDLKVHAFALMPNHYHLMLETGSVPLSTAMQWLVGRFVQKLNKRRGWDGAVFRGRFANKIVTGDAYWMHLVAYLHLNPVRAGLHRDPGSAWWTSHRDYMAGPGPHWLSRDELLEMHGGVTGYADYVESVQERRCQVPRRFVANALFTERELLERRCRALHDEGLSERRIAEALGKSRGWVRRVLRRGRDGTVGV